MWPAATGTLEAMGAQGTIHVAGRFLDTGPIYSAAAWSEIEADYAAELDGMIRDVRRAVGDRDREPEP